MFVPIFGEARLTRFSLPKPHKTLLCGFFLLFTPLFLAAQPNSQQSPQTTPTLIPDIALKAMIRDVLFSNTKPSARNTALFERIFLPHHQSPPTELLVPEFLFAEGEEVPPSYIVQTAQNLVWSKMFRSVKFSLDTTIAKRLDVNIDLEERPSIVPFLIAEAGGGVGSAGAGVDIVQLGGTATSLRATAEYRTMNGIGWQGSLDLESRRLWDWFNLRVHLLAHQFRNEQKVEIELPYSVDSPYFETHLTYSRAEGREFWYNNPTVLRMPDASALLPASFALKPFESHLGSAFIAVRGWTWDNEFYLLGRVALDASKRAAQEQSRVTDNSVQVHGGLALERRNFDLPEGMADWTRFGRPELGWYLHGLAGIISTVLDDQRRNPPYFLFRGGLQRFLGTSVYASVQGELSGFLTGQVLSLPCLACWYAGPGTAHLRLSVHYALSPEIVLATRFIAEGADSRLRPRHGAGTEMWVRGYGVNTLIGSGRIIGQIEVRGIPIAEVGVFKARGAVFFEAGRVSNVNFTTTAFESTGDLISCGAGLRLHYPSFAGGEGTLRVDVAYLPNLGRFGQIIIATQEAFSLFEDFPAKQARILNEQRWIE